MFPILKMEEELKHSIRMDQLFQSYRIVDPATYAVYDYQCGHLSLQAKRCYEFWNRSFPCDHCSSCHAKETGSTSIKLEHIEEAVFLVFSVPVILCEKNLVVELIAGMTQNSGIQYVQQMNSMKVGKLIEDLNDMTMRDPFTGLLHKNKSYMELRREIAWATIYQKPFCIAWIDIDNFKKVNDQYGHLTGDQVILLITNCIKEISVAHQGWAGRIGGDEFILVFRGCGREQTAAICEELSNSVCLHKLKEKNKCLSVSISYGITEYKMGQGLEEFLDEADRKMYQHKQEKKRQ